MGTSQAKLTVLHNRTVLLTGQPMANISDHLSMVNLAPFGKCRSIRYPATASATAANQGRLTPMPCMHNTPLPWMSGKNDYLIKGDPALLKSSTCSCMWGGTISLVTDGQTLTGPADLSKKAREDYKQKQTRSNIHDDGQITGGASNPFNSSFYLAKTMKNVYSMDEKTKRHLEELELLYDRLERLENIPESHRDSIEKSIDILYEQYFKLEIFATTSNIPGKNNPIGTALSFGGRFIDFAAESGFSIQRNKLSNYITHYENAEGKGYNGLNNYDTEYKQKPGNPFSPKNESHNSKQNKQPPNSGNSGVMGTLPSLEDALRINSERKKKLEDLYKQKELFQNKLNNFRKNPNQSSEMIKNAIIMWEDNIKYVDDEIWRIKNGL